MARSGGKSGEHLLKVMEKVDGGEGRQIDRPRFWCGSTSWYENHRVFPWNGQTCPGCSSAYFADYLKREPNGYSLEKITPPKEYSGPGVFGFKAYGWKSAWAVRAADGDLVAFIAMETGYGQRWNIYGLHSNLDEATGAVSFERGYFATHLKRWRDNNGVQAPTDKPYEGEAKNWNSKERALAEIPFMVADGFLKPASQLAAERVELWAERLVQAADRLEERMRLDEEREAHRLAKAAQDDAERAHMTEALSALLETATNYQREGLYLAAKRLGIELG